MNELTTYEKQLGYSTMQLRSANAELVSQETVRHLLGFLDPYGIELPCKGCTVIRCYLSKGANIVLHLESYDKLKPYGICMNEYIHGSSPNII